MWNFEFKSSDEGNTSYNRDLVTLFAIKSRIILETRLIYLHDSPTLTQCSHDAQVSAVMVSSNAGFIDEMQLITGYVTNNGTRNVNKHHVVCTYDCFTWYATGW